MAGLTLNIFNKHSDRVKMANIAQTVNVLQSVALTDGEDMLLTPTYFVFKMFRDHQDATLLGSYITTQNLSEKGRLPQLIESASVKEDGTIVSTVVNTSLTEPADILCQIADTAVSKVTAEILTGDPHDHNRFDDKDKVALRPFDGVTVTPDGFRAATPPCSVVKFLVK